MSTLNEPIAKRIDKLLRLLASPHEGERHNAVTMMQRTLAAERLSFNDIAIVIENHQGEIEERKYSDADAEIIFAKGVEKGRKDEERKQQAPPEFYDAGGQPRWQEIALFCQNNITRLRSEWERTFINPSPTKLHFPQKVAPAIALPACVVVGRQNRLQRRCGANFHAHVS
jgi:hypothetical protein